MLWAAWWKGIYPYGLTYLVHKDLLLVGFISQHNQDVLHIRGHKASEHCENGENGMLIDRTLIQSNG